MVTNEPSEGNKSGLSILEEVEQRARELAEDQKKFPERYMPDRFEQVGYFRKHPTHGICGTVFVPMEIMIAGKNAYGWQKGDSEMKKIGEVEVTSDGQKYMLNLPGNALIVWNKEQYQQLCSKRPGAPNSVSVVAKVKENTMPVGVRSGLNPRTRY